jgi:hypothetical protein
MLPACDLQAVLPECSQLSTHLRQAARLLQHRTGEHLRSQVLCSGSRPGSCLVCGSGSGLCSGSRDVRGSGSGHVCGSVCAQVRSGSRSDVRTGSRDLRGSGSGHVCGSVCAQVRSGSRSRELRRSLCSGCAEVLRYALPDQVLQCGSLRSGSLDL